MLRCDASGDRASSDELSKCVHNSRTADAVRQNVEFGLAQQGDFACFEFIHASYPKARTTVRGENGFPPAKSQQNFFTHPQTACEVLREHVVLETKSIDRMYLTAYVPQLQSVGEVVGYLHAHKGQRFASTTALAPMTETFVRAIERFARQQRVEVVHFEKWQRKNDVTQKYLARFQKSEGLLYIGKAQEKARVMRTERRRNVHTAATYPWVVESTAMVSHVYFYCVDQGFGPFFIKFCTYFPYNAKLCLNGNEYAKCQLRQRGIAFEALDNGVRSCDKPRALQRLFDGLGAAKIDRLLRKWLARLPYPFSKQDRGAGCRYALSILQAEFCLTQVLDRPVSGRVFFEDVIRENLDIGRPGQAQLIFGRRVTSRTLGRFRTRVITDGVTPSLHVDYKSTAASSGITSKLRRYAPRPPSTIPVNSFWAGSCITWRRCARVGFCANRRLLEVQTISHDCALGEADLQRHQRPVEINGQRAPGLRFADARVQALLSFVLLPHGFSNRDLREHLAPLLGLDPRQWRASKMTYDLRRLRMHGLIERVPKTHRYRITEQGLKIAMFYSRVYDRILRPGLAVLDPAAPECNSTMQRRFNAINDAIYSWCDQAKLPA